MLNTMTSNSVSKLLGRISVSSLAVAALFSMPLVDTSLQSGLFPSSNVNAAEEEGRRAPPPTTSSQTLSRQVYQRIEEIMELRDMEMFAEARLILDEIREMYDRDRLNDREKYTMFLFYASLDQAQEKYREALVSYREILKLERLTQDQIEQTWYYVASLLYVLEDFREAIDAFNSYNEIALEPNDDVYLRIATAYYQIEEFAEAVPPLLRNMELVRAKGEEIPENTYSLLRALYFTLEDYPAARQIVREMIVLYNNPDDWGYLASIEGQLENFTEQAYIYYVANVGNYLDSESQLLNLASQLYNNENPYGCAQVISKGMDDGIIDEDEDNLSFLSTCYQLAREDALAAEPLERAAALAEDGEMYARLGRIYMTMTEFEKAVEAFDTAFEIGDLDRPDQVYLSQARAYMELNRYDEGIEAARAAGRADERSADTSQTWVTVLNNEKTRYEFIQNSRVELAAYFRGRDQ